MSPDAWAGLAPIHDHIFPVRPAQLDFLSSIFGRSLHPVRTVLDVGCGTGAYARALAGRGFSVVGVDLDPGMVQRAEILTPRPRPSKRQRPAPTPRFLIADMADLSRLRGDPGPFDGLICLGNTLAHMLSAAELGTALGEMASVLVPQGRAVLQTVNYDRLELQGETRLPPLRVNVPEGDLRAVLGPEDAPGRTPPPRASGAKKAKKAGKAGKTEGSLRPLEFRRVYLPRADGLVTFVTSLHDPGTTRPLFRVETLLRPIVKEELVTIARMAFHGEVEAFGDFLFSGWTEASPATVVVATCGEER